MTDRFRVSRMLPQRLAELGVAPEAVLRHAGLPAGLFQQEKVQVTTEEFFALYHGIADASGDPAFGLKLGTESRVERYDPIAIAALYARSFRDAVGRLARYKQLTCPEKVHLLERGGGEASEREGRQGQDQGEHQRGVGDVAGVGADLAVHAAPGDDGRDFRIARDLFRDAASQEKLRHIRAAVRRHHDQITLTFGRAAHDNLRRIVTILWDDCFDHLH